MSSGAAQRPLFEVFIVLFFCAEVFPQKPPEQVKSESRQRRRTGGGTRAGRCSGLPKVHGLAEHFAPVLVIFKLVKARASGRKQHNIARHGALRGFGNSF